MIKVQRPVVVLTVIIMLLIAFISLYAIMTEDNGAPYSAVSLRGEQVEIYGGNGLYAFNTTENAIMMRAFDWYFLFALLPVMFTGLVLYIRRSMIGFFILLSSLFFCIYNYIINSVAFAYNDLFLAYMILFILGILEAIYCIRGIHADSFKKQVLPKLPGRLISVANFVFATYFILSWLIIDFTALFKGSIHPDLSIYTTAGINITDLSIYVPLAVSSGVMLLKRKPLGAMMSVGILLMVFQEMVALNIFQFVKVGYLGQGPEHLEFSLCIIALMSLVPGILAVRKLKGIKAVFSEEFGQPV